MLKVEKVFYFFNLCNFINKKGKRIAVFAITSLATFDPTGVLGLAAIIFNEFKNKCENIVDTSDKYKVLTIKLHDLKA